jgi:hypothetical protein
MKPNIPIPDPEISAFPNTEPIIRVLRPVSSRDTEIASLGIIPPRVYIYVIYNNPMTHTGTRALPCLALSGRCEGVIRKEKWFTTGRYEFVQEKRRSGKGCQRKHPSW